MSTTGAGQQVLDESSSSGRALDRWRLPSLFDRVRLAPLLVVCVLGVAVFTDTLSHPLPAPLLDAWGFRVSDLFVKPWRILTCPFFIYRPSMALSIVGIVLLFVGLAELRVGLKWAALSFLAGHLAGYILGPLVMRAVDALLGFGGDMVVVRDVGASNGAFGAWGAVLAVWPRRRAWPLIAGTTIYLLIALAVSAQVWDVGHLCAFPAGVLVGAIHARRQGSFARVPGTFHATVSVPEALGVGIAILGGMHVLAALTLARHAGFARLESWLPLGEVDWSRVLLAWIGLALCALAPALYRGQRAAWVITVVALLVTMVPTAIVHPSPVAIALSLALVGLLLWFRRRFQAPARWMERPGGWVSALAPLAGAVVILVLSGLLIRHEFRPTLAGASWMKMVVYRLSGTSVTDVLGGTGVHPTHTVARAVVRLIPWVTWPLALLTVLRIAEGAAAPRARGRDRLRARGILARDGATGTAPMTLWPGNSVRPLLGSTAFCAFRVAYGQAVVLGEPIGASQRFAEALSEFDAYCNQRGWNAVYYAVSDANAERFRNAGFQLLQIGVEAILPLTDLEFRGKTWQSTRSALHRAEREGIRFELHPGDRIPPATLAAVRESDQVWTQHHELPPMEFVLGDLRKMLAPEVMVAVALDAADHVHAFASWLPVPARKGWVIDLMRRGEPAMSGIMEYLIAQSMIALKGRGAELVSLATAPLAELDQNPDRSFVQGLLNRVFERVHHPYDFQALYEFKAKFQPSWEPVHLAYRKDAELPAIALALARAHLPEFGIGMLVATVGRGLADRLWTQAQAMRNAGDSEGD